METEENRIYSPLRPNKRNLDTPLSFPGQGDGDGGNMIASAVLLPFFFLASFYKNDREVGGCKIDIQHQRRNEIVWDCTRLVISI